MKITAYKADAFLAKPAENLQAILLYGPDQGLVSERAENFCKTYLGKSYNEESLHILTTEEIIAQPALLSEKLFGLSLFSDRQLIQLRQANDKMTATLKQSFTGATQPANFLIVTAGDLPPRSPLRKWAEQEDMVASIGCYAADYNAMVQIIKNWFAQEDITLAAEALPWLAQNLSNDRQLVKRELEKLTLFAGSKKILSLEDVKKASTAHAGYDSDDLAMALGDCQISQSLHIAHMLLYEGVSTIGILRIISRHFDRLYQALSAYEQGQSMAEALGKLHPPVFFKIKNRFENQMSLWNSKKCQSVLALLYHTEYLCKQNHMPAQTIISQMLTVICQQGKGQKAAV